MSKLVEVDWGALFIPTHSILEMIIRGSIMYLALFVILRFIMKRPAGTLGIADVLVIVVIADAAQNAFAKEYQSVTEGIVLVVTIVLWDYAADWIGHRYPAAARLLQPAALLLVRNGRMIRPNMRREFITPDELMSQLRQQGVDDVSDVKQAHLEGDGQISVIRKQPSGTSPASARKKVHQRV